MECLNCNKSNPGGSVYCSNCGKSLLISPDNPAGIEWVEIINGQFLCSDDIYGGDSLTLQGSFIIGKYPVTNAQYKIFIDTNPDIDVPKNWDKEKREYPAGKENHPVSYISFNDAYNFCRWGGYRLPTSIEWEKASRGTDGRKYPWGEDWQDGKYCNSQESGIGDTTPVNKYTEGASPYGIMDTIGNIWEWCNSRDNTVRTMKVLRGGSFASTKDSLSCAYKYGSEPECNYMPYGFRCVDFLHIK